MVPETKRELLELVRVRVTSVIGALAAAQRRHSRLQQLVVDRAMPSRARELREAGTVAFETIVVDNASTRRNEGRNSRVSVGPLRP